MTTPTPTAGTSRRRALLVTLRLLGQALEFLAWVVLARRLPGDVLGQLTVAFLVCRYAGLLADWGARCSGARDLAAGAPLAALLPLTRRRARLTAALAALFVAVTVATGQVGLAPLAAVLCQQGVNREWVALGQGRMTAAGVPAVAQGAALLLLALVVPAHITGATVALGSAYALSLAASHVVNRLPREAAAVGAAAPTGWMVAGVLADQVLATADTFLLAILVSPSEAGVYAVVYRLPNAWLTVVGLVSASLVPLAATALAADRDQLAGLRSRLLGAGVTAGAVALLAAPLVGLAVPVVFGPRYAHAAAAATVLVLASAVITVTAALQPAYLALARDADYSRGQLVAAATNLGANLALIPAFGMLGAALATLLAQVLLLGIVAAGLRQADRDAPPLVSRA